MRQRGDTPSAWNPLAASHGDRRIVEELKGDVDAGIDACSYCVNSRMEVRSVTQVLEHVLRVHEWSQADPLGALGSHWHNRKQFVVLVTLFCVNHGVAKI